MNRLQLEIHNLLKKKFEKASGSAMVCQKSLLPSRNKFYFEDLRQNLYEPMSGGAAEAFSIGKGGEKDDKIYALRSSAAMTFNIFGNGPVSVKENSLIGEGEYKLSYAVPLETILRGKETVMGDALLESDKELNFFDMKLFEPVYHKTSFEKELSESYEDSDRYFYTESAYSFNEAISRLRRSGIKRYDACEMFKLSLGIYNFIRKNGIKNRKVNLVNCVWTLNEPLSEEKLQQQYNNIEFEEFSGFAKFKECMFNVENIFSKQNIDFSFHLMKIQDLVSMIETSDEKRNWLARYL